MKVISGVFVIWTLFIICCDGKQSKREIGTFDLSRKNTKGLRSLDRNKAGYDMLSIVVMIKDKIIKRNFGLVQEKRMHVTEPSINSCSSKFLSYNHDY
jgi:hypothetical protein